MNEYLRVCTFCIHTHIHIHIHIMSVCFCLSNPLPKIMVDNADQRHRLWENEINAGKIINSFTAKQKT